MRNIHSVDVVRYSKSCYRCMSTIKSFDPFVTLLGRSICVICVRCIYLNMENELEDKDGKISKTIKKLASKREDENFKKFVAINYRNRIFHALVNAGISREKLYKLFTGGKSPEAQIQVSNGVDPNKSDYFQIIANIFVNGAGHITVYSKSVLVADIMPADPDGIEKVVKIIVNIVAQYLKSL